MKLYTTFIDDCKPSNLQVITPNKTISLAIDKAFVKRIANRVFDNIFVRKPLNASGTDQVVINDPVSARLTGYRIARKFKRKIATTIRNRRTGVCVAIRKIIDK